MLEIKLTFPIFQVFRILQNTKKPTTLEIYGFFCKKVYLYTVFLKSTSNIILKKGSDFLNRSRNFHFFDDLTNFNEESHNLKFLFSYFSLHFLILSLKAQPTGCQVHKWTLVSASLFFSNIAAIFLIRCLRL